MSWRNEKQHKPRSEKDSDFRFDQKQPRNQYSSAGITAREASSLMNAIRACDRVLGKPNLYIQYELKLKEARDYIEEVLREANRL